jgi:F5/8 type C domain
MRTALRAAGLVVAALMFAVALSAAPAPSSSVMIEDFEDISDWSVHPAEGVTASLHADSGSTGRGLRLDVSFTHGTGYAVIRRPVPLDLPENYAFRFRMRGEIPMSHLEFKLVDSTGQNVWWHVRRDLDYPREWRTFTTRHRQVRFAWGPSGGGELRQLGFIEFAVVAAEGGSGSAWFDDLTFETLPADSAWPAPIASASSAARANPASHAVDGDYSTSWVAKRERESWLALDLGGPREMSGVVVHWPSGFAPPDYAVELTSDGRSWSTAHVVRGSNGGRDPVYLPETEARQVRVLSVGRNAKPLTIAELQVHPVEWASSPEAFFTALAGNAPRGNFPRAYLGEGLAWAVVGVDGGREEALLGEDGALEVGKKQFTLEPFLEIGGRLITWADVRTEVSLDEGRLPIPTVRWIHPDATLEVTAFAAGDTANSRAYLRYRLTPTAGQRRATLYVAMRPFQVNPPWQSVGMSGGTARIDSVVREGTLVRVNGDRSVLSLTPPTDFGAASMDAGDIVEHLRTGRLPNADRAQDRNGFASAAWSYSFDFTSGGATNREVVLSVPLRAGARVARESPASVDSLERRVARDWRAKEERVRIELPPSAREVQQTLEAQIAWILINRDAGSIQPGSRSYDRSWIRDGSLTSSALLRLGHANVVRDFIEWFAPFQQESGRVPCCADFRGPDPVAEHDSHGQFISLVAEYYRYTGDRALVERQWPRVMRAVDYLDFMRHERRTAAWKTQDQGRYYGLVLPSISHEGYPNPVHSYWDDFFAYRGYVDAADLARSLGHERAFRIAAARDTFARDLAASVRATMVHHKIPYVPGCAELGDFDATSTTVALAPTGAADLLSAAAIDSTFERYWRFFRDRRDGTLDWSGYTPYETRVIGSFVRLGWRDRANQALNFFLADRRPIAWRQWAEVVHREPRAPKFFGDLPHTWVGSDFVRSVLDMLCYERPRDQALVIGAGVPWSWVAEAPGVHVHDLRTPYGTLSYTMAARGDSLVVELESTGRVPPGGFVIAPPEGERFKSATLDATGIPFNARDGVVARSRSGRIVFRP